MATSRLARGIEPYLTPMVVNIPTKTEPLSRSREEKGGDTEALDSVRVSRRFRGYHVHLGGRAYTIVATNP